jgi:hypothetical protein
MRYELHTITEDEQDTLYENEEYEHSYYAEFEALEEKDHTKDFLKVLGRNWINEDTPVGEVIMTYNSDSESFWYYADHRNIPYRVLDSVAHRFAIKNDCKSVCVNYKEEFEKGKNAILASMKCDNENAVPQNNGHKKHFAVFKSYNTKKGYNKKNNYIITENANRFTYKGPTSEWNDQNDLLHCDSPKLSYADFKSRQHVCVPELVLPSQRDATQSADEKWKHE